MEPVTTLYVMVVNDRHTDPTPFVFSGREQAVDAARKHFGDRFDSRNADDDELGEQEIDGWLYYAKWSHEGDDVWVVERQLDGPVDV